MWIPEDQVEPETAEIARRAGRSRADRPPEIDEPPAPSGSPSPVTPRVPTLGGNAAKERQPED